MSYKRSRQTFEADLQKQESPYVFYGAPLPPLDEHVRDDGSFVPIWKQEVTDDRGRKRLHGAFTGGFSAGYYNTVGSKEGWTPSTFVSSRQNRMKDAQTSKQQKPEDYMDEDDLREVEEARHLQTSDAFSGFGTEHDERRKGAVMEIFRPSEETAGVRLLRRMGWKEGQGIGPRIKRSANLDDDIQQTEELHAFAPDDVPMISFNRKNDRKGLGYEGEGLSLKGTEPVSTKARRKVASHDSDEDNGSSTGPIIRPSKTKANNKKGAFGLGILNDTGSDDDTDPYSMGPKISYNKTIGGDRKLKKKPLVLSSNANPALKTKPALLSKKLLNLQGALRKCHDGRLPLDGFVLDDDLNGMASLSLKNEQYKPPEVPSDWKSAFTPDEADTELLDFISVADEAKASTHSSKSRASLLAEAPLPGKSVFDFLSPSTRDRLAEASGRSNLPPGMGEKPTPSPEARNQTLQSLMPKLDQDIALTALSRGESGWMPYADDPSKRNRYKTYLEIRAGLRTTSSSDETPPRAPDMTQEEWLIELQEFARGAEIFRPVTGAMASRFTSSSTAQPHSSNSNRSKSAEDLLTRPVTKPEDPAITAARTGMFGHLTRSVVNFYPTRLLCKRFGVPTPDHTNIVPPESSSSSSMREHAANFNTSNFQSAGYQSNEKDEPGAAEPPSTLATRLANQETASDDVPGNRPASATIDTGRNEALEKEKPGQALFKAIFGSDDEDDEEDI